MKKKLVTLDGNEAAANIAYEFTEVATIYPITPSSPMAELTDAWSANGRKNMFGQTVSLMEMQSEAGAIGAVHGAAQTGSLATSFTSSQGLMLMIPVLHRISGERLPVVLHVAARTVGTHAMSIFGDHSDVMGCRNTGFAMICSGSVQEVVDLAGVAHLAAVKGQTPFMHFFDGFRTSHEINTVEMIDTQKLRGLMDLDSLEAFRHHALNPEHPFMRSTVQNPDIFFQVREASNRYYDALPDIVEHYFSEINKITGRDYHLFNYYGAPDATEVVIAMGSVSGTVKEAVDYLNSRGRKTGFIQVHLYRPFSMDHLMKVMPACVRKIAVLDRTKEPGSIGEPLYEDVCTALARAGFRADVVGGRYGLSSKDTEPGQIVAVFDNLLSTQPKNGFTIGINDDVTHLSLPLADYDAQPSCFACKFWGLGGDGTVGANKNTVHIVSEQAGMFGQAYFEYDAKKSFGVTKSHLRFSRNPIESSYYVKKADFVACHNQSYIGQYDIVSEVSEGGSFLLNCNKTDEELGEWLPDDVKLTLARKHIRFYVINATAIAMRLGLGSHTNTVLQAAFFATSGLMDKDSALEAMKAAARKTYFTKGEEVITKNIQAIECGENEVHQVSVPSEWANLIAHPSSLITNHSSSYPDIVRKMLLPVNRQKGDDLPVSNFTDYVDGTVELGLTAYEKRGIAVQVPKWNPEKCIQCNRCSLVCPHAVIRPYILDEEEKNSAPEGLATIPAVGSKVKGMYFTLTVSDYDCTGCASCVTNCPTDSLEMQPFVPSQNQSNDNAPSLNISPKEDFFNPYSVKGSQFRRPLVEYSAACAGCGETPYAKLLTQLFGDRVYWANATGCSQAWGSAMPGIPYCTNERGHGPAWTNSLFENNAELCLGMFLSVRQRRNFVRERVEELLSQSEGELRDICQQYLDSFDDLDASRLTADRLIHRLQSDHSLPEALRTSILSNKDMLSRKTFWMYGGDGWAYDIGFGGLDHVIASGENINVFVIDNELYANTGGQSSKATPVGAVAKFASSGKKSRKKDLGAIMMTYGNVYVAQVAMGADPAQLIKAIKEAEEYDGPSVIIAYTPCLSHGIRIGMDHVQAEMKRAVESGYWHLYRYDPRKEHPFQLDSKAPTMSYTEFLDGEVRFSSLRRTFPANADTLFAQGQAEAATRTAHFQDLDI